MLVLTLPGWPPNTVAAVSCIGGPQSAAAPPKAGPISKAPAGAVQNDGNVVLYDADNVAVWGAAHNGGVKAFTDSLTLPDELEIYNYESPVPLGSLLA